MADEFIRDDENLTLADGDSAAGQSTTVEVGADGAVLLPAGVNFGNAEFAQSGSDMVITAPDGTEVVIEGYFDQESAPMLKTPGGAELAGDTATHLARVLSPTQEVAQAAPTSDAQPIGQVESVSGTVVAIRANGDRVELEAGDPVFQGDVLQSGEDGAIGIVLADETTFSMADNGRMVLDEMVYDPGTQEGSISMSVLQGVFTFVSGQVAKVDPDAMTLKTPVATIGIRGTQVGIDLGETADGTPDLRVVLMEESDGFVGEVVISNAGGIQILNLPDQGSTVSNVDSAPAEPRVFQRSEIRESFSDALDSLPTAVGTGNNYAPSEDERQEQEEQQENEEEAAAEEGLEEFDTAAGGEAVEEGAEAGADEFAEQDEEATEAGSDEFAETANENGEEESEGEDLEDFETAAGGEEEGDASATTTGDVPAGGQEGEVDEDLEDFETAAGGEEEEAPAVDDVPGGAGDFIEVASDENDGISGGSGGGSTGDPVVDESDDDPDNRLINTDPEPDPGPVIVPNQGPSATDDRQELSEDNSAVINVLGNDTDPDNDPLSVTGVTQPNHGTAAINDDGTVTYTPDDSYNGEDSFTYTISDGQGGTSTATVSLSVDPINDNPVAIDDRFKLDEDIATTLDLIGTRNGDGDADSDPDGDSLTITEINGTPISAGGSVTTAHGTVTLNADGTVEFTPAADYNGTESFEYTISDGQGGTDTATVNLTVDPVNDVPVAVDDIKTLAEDSSAIINVLANDDDGGDGGMTLDSVTQPEHGTVTIVDGQVQYTPDANYNGTDSFTYTISDIDGDTSTATVNLTVNLTVDPVNDVPVAVDDIKNLDEDSSAVIDVMANDTDGDGDGLNLDFVTQPEHGTVTINADGTVTYTPEANYKGADSFTYTISDANGDTSTATVSLSVDSENDVPVAVDDSQILDEDSSALIGVLANDDAGGDGGMTLDSVCQPEHGTVTIVDGQVQYTPDADYNGTDSFTYTISDANGDTSTATVNLTVNPTNDVPVAVDDIKTLAEDSSAIINVMANDDAGGDGGMSLDSITQPEHGTVVINADGTVTYTPDANYNGTDSFTYTISDIDGDTSTATVNLTVDPANDDPVAVDDSATLDEDASAVINVLANDSDLDGDDIFVGSVTEPEHGTVAINEDGTVTYTPDANYAGADSFTYTIFDGAGNSDTATVSLSVTGDADAPVVVAGDVSGAEDGGWIGLDLSANLADSDGSETLAITISNVPEGAQLSAGTDLGGGNWTVAPEELSLLSINPAGDFSGNMDLGVSVTATEAGGDTATVDSAFTVTVTPTGDVTVSVDDVTGAEDASEIGLGLSISSFSIDDADGSEVLQSIEITFTDLPEGAVVNNATYNQETGTYTVPTAAALAIVSVSAPENWSGDFSATLTVTSNEGSASQSFGVSVSPGNDAPVITTSPVFAMNEDGTIVISETELLAGASDVEGDALSVTDLVVNGGTGTLTGPDAGGNYTYQPPENFSGDVSLEYNVSDGTASTPQTASIAVAAVADAPDLAVEIGDGVAVTSGGDPVDVSIDMDSVADTDAGFTVTARSIDNEGELTDASADNIAFHNTSPEGFGVGGSASGADSELGYDSDSGISEQLIVSFDSDVSSVDVSFAWKHSGEDATFEFFKDGVKVGEGTSIGGSDGIDPAVTLALENGASFDQIVFLAPGTGDDYLINSIEFEAVENSETVIEYPVTISAGLVDTDGSEALSSITIDMEGMPQGVSFSAGGLNADGNWELTPAQLDGLTMTAPESSGDIALTVSVTSTEADGDAATTTVTATADAPNIGPEVSDAPEFAMNEDGTIAISEAQLLEGASDVDGDALSVTDLVVNGGEGTLTGPDGDGNYSYQPSADFSGNVTLNYNVSDGSASVAQTASIAVAGVADTPDLATGVTGVSQVLADTEVPVSQSLLDQVDADHIVTVTGVPDGATLSAGVENSDGSWTLTGDVLEGLEVSPPDGFSGEMSFEISVNDPGETTTLLEADFNSDLDGFTYSDDAFGTSNARHASGELDDNDGTDGSGALEVKLGGGGGDDDDSVDMSGGFEQSFTVTEDGTATLTFSYRMDQDNAYENDEYSEILVSIDGELVSLDGNDYIARIEGGGDTGWQTVTLDLGSLPAGEHSLVLGGYNNKSTSRSEKTEINFDDLSLTLETSAEEVAAESVAFAPDISAHVYGVDVEAALSDASETLSEITFEGLPDGATLNAGSADGEGGWTVDAGDLAGLEVTVPEGSAAFELTVSATSTEENGDTASVTQTLDFSDHLGADSADTLYGGSGVDYLSGGEGADVIYGESGNDIILGGAGDDEFIFNLGDGNDTIFDFEAGDELSFDGVSLADGDTVEITTDGSDVVITIFGKDGTEASKVTLKDSAAEDDGSSDSSSGTENSGDGYSVTDSGDGGITIVVDQVT
jgi:CshA-type fibril repeat protein/VCBS repeat-containing protein